MEKRQFQAFYGETMAKAVALAMPVILEALWKFKWTIRVGTCAGSTVRPFFDALAKERQVGTPWDDVIRRLIFMTGDERVVEPTSPACNLGALGRDLFGPLRVSDDHIEWFRFDEEAEDSGLAELNGRFRKRGGAVDVNIAALGPRDAGFGHFYSIFGPVLDQIWDATEYVLVEQGEKEPRRRVTLPPKVVLAAPLNLVFVSKGREDVLRAFFEDSAQFADCPGRMLRYYDALPGTAKGKLPLRTILVSDCDPSGFVVE